MTLEHLREAIKAYLHRGANSFISENNFDILLQACNNARLYAERVVDFEYSRTEVEFPSVDVAAGADLGTAVLVGTSTGVKVKKVEQAFLSLGVDSTFPIDIYSRNKNLLIVKKKFEGTKPTDPPGQVTDVNYHFVQLGTKFYIYPRDEKNLGTTFKVYADAFRWLNPYKNNSDTDFLLEYCFDWLLYRSVFELNFFLKEDERVDISTGLLADSWNAVIKWNNNIVGASSADASLD